MKKVFVFIFLLLNFSFSISAHDLYTAMAVSLGLSMEDGSVSGEKIRSEQANLGLFSSLVYYPSSKYPGIHLDMDLHFANWGLSDSEDSAISSIAGSNTFSVSWQFAFGPSLKSEPGDVLIQFAPEVCIAVESERGDFGNTSYSYFGSLFGFGGDISVAILPKHKYCPFIGTHFAYYPIYNSSINFDSESQSLDLDNYNRLSMNLYMGLQIHFGK